MAPPAARTERDGNIPNGIQNEVMALHYFFFSPFKPYYFILGTTGAKFYAFITALAHTPYTLNHEFLILNLKILNTKRI